MPKKIKQLINEMEESKMIIPSFQRDYEWEKEQIEALFDSLLRDLPINSILLWMLNGEDINDKNKVPFDFYQFNSNFEKYYSTNNILTTKTRDEYKVVIDGQQRLTSLYIGFAGSYSERKKYSRKFPNSKNVIEKKLYLCLPKNEEISKSEESLEDNIYSFKFLSEEEIRRKTNNCFQKDANLYTDIEGRHWLRISSIPHIKFEYLSEMDDEYKLNNKEKATLLAIWNLYHNKEVINTIEWESKDINEAITVFVRYNSKGTVLTPAQVIQSIISVHWPDVRKSFEGLIKEIRQIGFYINVNYIIKALLSVYNNDPKNDLKVINEQVSKKFEDNWDIFSKWVTEMFTELANLGFSHRNLFAYNATIPILYYLINKKEIKEEGWKTIGSWLVRTLLLGSFTGNSDYAIKKSIDTINASNQDNFPKDSLTKALRERSNNLEINKLLNIGKEKKEAPLLMTILLPEKWNKIAELDHLHPISIFKKRYPKELERANSIINLQPLRGDVNGSKNNKNLKEWVDLKYPKEEDRNTYLSSIGIDPTIDLDFENRHNLWNMREKLFRTKLEEFFEGNLIEDDLDED